MPNLDQFESAFKAAAKTPYRFEPAEIRSVLVVTDKEEAGAERFAAEVRRFLTVLGDGVRWKIVRGGEYRTTGDLLDLVRGEDPDLVCTYPNLHSDDWRWPYSLGNAVTALTQEVRAAILMMPHPDANQAAAHAVQNTDRVMVVTDHLTGDHRLVNLALRFTQPRGTLFLAHVEDRAVFERYVEVISKIPAIDTQTAREAIITQLLREPRDYIESCRRTLQERGVRIEVRDLVTVGRRIAEYRNLIQQHEVDLLLFHTRDEDQLAMHGMAHPLAVEMRHIPLLMI